MFHSQMSQYGTSNGSAKSYLVLGSPTGHSFHTRPPHWPPYRLWTCPLLSLLWPGWPMTQNPSVCGQKGILQSLSNVTLWGTVLPIRTPTWVIHRHCALPVRALSSFYTISIPPVSTGLLFLLFLSHVLSLEQKLTIYIRSWKCWAPRQILQRRSPYSNISRLRRRGQRGDSDIFPREPQFSWVSFCKVAPPSPKWEL